jgi:putative ABC transport system permease protein
MLINDIRYGVRALVRRPGFTLVAVVTLAVGIGASTAIFSVVNGVLLRPLPYPEPDRLVTLRESNSTKQPDSQVSPANFLEWQRQNTVFASLAAYRSVSYNLTGDGNPERLLAGRVSPGLFTMLGTQPILGRDFLSEEDQVGREKVVLISHGLWQRRFGSDANIVSKTIKLNGENYTIVGVMPADFRLPDQRERELWTPIAFKDDEKTFHQARFVDVIGRLKGGVSLDQAQAEMVTIANRISQEYPEANSGWTIKLTPVLDYALGSARTILWVLFCAVGLVLLIGCANVTNLLLVRATTRQREMAIRAALGARRSRIVRQLTTESLLLALLGGLVGWPLAIWGLQALLAVAPPDLPRLSSVTIDRSALLFSFGVTLLTAIAFGVAPAVQLAKVDLNRALKVSGGDGRQGIPQQRVGNLLISAEVALAITLLVGGGLLARTVWQLQRVKLGFDERNALTVTLQLPEKKYADDHSVGLFSQQLVQEISTLPGVESSAVARILPIMHNLPAGFYVEGRQRQPDNQLPLTNYSAVSPAYFKAMGIPLVAGRAFTDRDGENSPRVAIISESLAQHFFSGENPIGKRINVTTGQERYREIIGIVGDVKQKGLTQETAPHTYEPFAQAPDRFMTLVMRTSSDPMALVPAIRSKVLALDSDLPLQRVSTLDRVIANSIRPQRFTSAVLAVFAGVALFLAAAGLYGVISYSVAQRTRELGIRVALGAQVPDVMKLVLKEGMKFVLIGEVVGLAAAFGLTRLLSTLLFGVTPTDAPTFIGVTLMSTAVGLVACYIPARRATKVDPLVALKAE